MPKATLRFYEELNDFLAKPRRKTDFEVGFKKKRSIKDMIEALGVPHTEVDLILVNGKSVDFNYILQDGDSISVYPVFEALNIGNVTHLRKIPLRRTKFIADINLGKIVRYMRLLGFDVYFDPLLSPREIIKISKRENRLILTTSKKLLKLKDVTHGIFVRGGAITEQIKGIISFLDIKDRAKPFSRCPCCNGLLRAIAKREIADRIPPLVKEFYNDFTYCNSCDKIYWKGTHYVTMKKVIKQVLV